MVVQRVFALVVSFALLSILSGCVAPDGGDHGLPRLDIEVEPQETLADLDLEIMVVFENTHDEPFVVVAPEDCLRLEVMARSATTLVPLDDPDRSGCADGATEFRIEPGERREWGPYTFNPGEYQTPRGEPHFPPGLFTLRAQFFAQQTSWDAAGETEVRILEGDLPKITVQGEEDAWRQGESGAIIARFVNDGPVPFHFTSRNGCLDIEVHAMNIQDEQEYTRLWPAEGPYACPEAVTNYTIEVGQEVVWEVVWDGSRDGQGGEPYVQPGGYFIRGSFNAIEADWGTSVHEQVRILPPEEENG